MVEKFLGQNVTYGFPYYGIFIWNEWRDKGFAAATLKVNSMART